MNTITNDRNETVIAVGAPGSLARVQVEYPRTIELVKGMLQIKTEKAEISKYLFDKGIQSHMEMNNIIIAADTLRMTGESTTRTNYYQDQLEALDALDTLKVQIRGENGETKWLQLNNESVDEILFFLLNHKRFVKKHCNGVYGYRLHKGLDEDRIESGSGSEGKD